MMNILIIQKNLKCLCVFEADVIKLPFIAISFKFYVCIKIPKPLSSTRACVCVWLFFIYFISRSKGHSPGHVLKISSFSSIFEKVQFLSACIIFSSTNSNVLNLVFFYGLVSLRFSRRNKINNKKTLILPGKILLHAHRNFKL